MSRPLRIEYPGAWYHVMNRGRRRERIFFDENDYRAFLDTLGKATRLFSAEIHAYALMPNHYHLLMKTPKGNLSRVMRHINGVYTQQFNKKNKIDGSLFRGRYKAIIIEEESYLLELVRYIHKNPVKSKLEDKPGQYKWSSHKGYMKDNFREEWLKTKEVLVKFNKYTNEAKRELEAFISKEVPKDIMKKLEGINWPVMLGGKEFKEKIKKHIKSEKLQIEEMPEYSREMLDKGETAKKISRIKEKYGEILENKGIRANGMLRRALMYVLRKDLAMTLSEISYMAGRIRYTAISNQYKKAEEEINKKEGCYCKLKEINELLNE